MTEILRSYKFHSMIFYLFIYLCIYLFFNKLFFFSFWKIQGMDFTTDKLRSLVRKWQTLIEAHVDVKTTDNYTLRLFCIAFTKKRVNQNKKTCYAQSSQIQQVLLICKSWFCDFILFTISLPFSYKFYSLNKEMFDDLEWLQQCVYRCYDQWWGCQLR